MRKLLLCCLPLLACATTTTSLPAPASTGALHRVQRVQVAEGVELELLDFGGQGPALVFLAGRGNTGHVFDDFAPEFRSAYHVYSVTRRGYGASSWPEQGYDTATLSADVVRVLDSQRIAKAVLVGHSLAGEEITWVATHHPERVEKVLFLDIQTRGDLVAELYRVVPLPTPREPDPTLLASRATLAAAIARDVGGPFPEHEIDETVEFEPKTGRYLRDRQRPDADARLAMSALKVDFAAIRAPVLYLHTGELPPERAEEVGGFAQLTAAQQKKLMEMIPKGLQRVAEVRSMPGWRIVQLAHADHYIWITNRDDVLREMKAFLGM
jgi:pimeloyl-ACP methyl ester carboxylesterase